MMTANHSDLGKVSFYGKKSKVPCLQARLTRREKEFKKWPAPTPYKPILGGPTSCWRVFKIQKDAFNFARSNSFVSVFSCESDGFYDNHGQRLFLVTSYDQLWHYYRQLKDPQRHHYEVIPEGSVCRLYFDMEYSKAHNPDRDGDYMMEIFIKYVIHQLHQVFNISCSRCHILQLDASTPEKFSQHLIFHLTDSIFQDNIHAGSFVHQIHDELDQILSGEGIHLSDCKKLKHSHTTSTNEEDAAVVDNTETVDTDNKESSSTQSILTSSGLTLDDLHLLKVKDKEGCKVTFCDTSVYSKNRNFRLYLSCKLGRKNPLVVAKGNQYISVVPKGVTRSTDEQTFLDSLITNIQYHPGLRMLSMPDVAKSRKLPSVTQEKHIQTDTLGGYQSSPYPELDSYITSLLTRGGTLGAIRQWSYFSSVELMVYDITRNRWCDNIGRQHKSNNVIYIADMRRRMHYQKCHDPQCKAENYKSPEVPIPRDVLPEAYFSDIDCDLDLVLDDVSDGDLLLAAYEVEKTLAERDPNIHPGPDIPDFDDDDDDLLNAIEGMENV